jgi:carbonic anhydrase
MEFNEIIDRLKDGNKRFVEDKLDGRLENSEKRMELTKGQSPYAIILSCADSRVMPELIFDTELGELFVVRVAGNIANTSSIASIEYAVAHLGSKVIIVLGHESCGAVTAAVEGGDNGYNLNHLLAHILPALEMAKSGEMIDVIKKNAHLAARELESRSQIISDAVGSGQVRILTAYYHLSSGEVEFLE